MNAQKMKEAWEAFRQGDHVTTADLEAMRRQIVEALPFLNHHPDAGAMRKVAVTDLSNIESYLETRRRESTRKLATAFGKLSWQSPH